MRTTTEILNDFADLPGFTPTYSFTVCEEYIWFELWFPDEYWIRFELPVPKSWRTANNPGITNLVTNYPDNFESWNKEIREILTKLGKLK